MQGKKNTVQRHRIQNAVDDFIPTMLENVCADCSAIPKTKPACRHNLCIRRFYRCQKTTHKTLRMWIEQSLSSSTMHCIKRIILLDSKCIRLVMQSSNGDFHTFSLRRKYAFSNLDLNIFRSTDVLLIYIADAAVGKLRKHQPRSVSKWQRLRCLRPGGRDSGSNLVILTSRVGFRRSSPARACDCHRPER